MSKKDLSYDLFVLSTSSKQVKLFFFQLLEIYGRGSITNKNSFFLWNLKPNKTIGFVKPLWTPYHRFCKGRGLARGQPVCVSLIYSLSQLLADNQRPLAPHRSINRTLCCLYGENGDYAVHLALSTYARRSRHLHPILRLSLCLTISRLLHPGGM